jgi:hypothetical protein
MRLDFFTIQAMQCPAHYEWGPGPQVNNVNPTSAASHHFESSALPLFIDEVTPTSQQHDMTPLGGHKSDK